MPRFGLSKFPTITSFIPEAITYLSPPLTLLCSGLCAEVGFVRGQARSK